MHCLVLTPAVQPPPPAFRSFTLERQLGEATFLAAYRHLAAMQASSDPGDPAAAAALDRMLGDKPHLARHIYKLLVMEKAVYRN